MEVLRSRTLIEKTVADLKLNVVYINQGRVKDAEIYKSSPILIDFVPLNDLSKNKSHFFKVQSVSKSTFKLFENEKDLGIFGYDKIIKVNAGHITISKNAIDAMEGKGKLQIILTTTPEWAHVDIKDSGKGMTPKQIRTIFKPGYTTKKRGWGLGLTLVKRIVEEYHKGKVFVVESQPGAGTTFRVSIPM